MRKQRETAAGEFKPAKLLVNIGKFLLDMGKYLLTSVVIAGIFGKRYAESLVIITAVVSMVFVVVGLIFASRTE